MGDMISSPLVGPYKYITTKGNNGYFAIKVYLSKAYNRLSWEFIWHILNEIKLHECMIKVIMHVVTSLGTNVK